MIYVLLLGVKITPSTHPGKFHNGEIGRHDNVPKPGVLVLLGGTICQHRSGKYSVAEMLVNYYPIVLIGIVFVN